uniref:CUB domain-containing protein n=1 Tax=Anopheles atroparvus TaxID=41427 RepID=A0AAG5CP76_ANOAO
MYCGEWRDLAVRSDGRYFRITMASNDRLDATGFRAQYTFETTPVTTERAEVTIGKVTTSVARKMHDPSAMLLGALALSPAMALITGPSTAGICIIRIIGLELIKFLQD